MIYILDTDADIAYILYKWYKVHGFEAKAFSSLELLVQQLQNNHPNHIIVDCFLGRIATASKICDMLRNVCLYNGNILITSTSNLSAKDVEACTATHFIPKPFDLMKTLDIMNNLNATAAIG